MSWSVHHGDCRDLMAGMAESSVDSIVTDPPYHLTSIVKRFGAEGAAPAQVGATGAYARASAGFMGQRWDGGDVAFQPATWAAALRVLKPGGHLVAFSGSRTYHRMVCAIEDAGFEIRDQIMWLYGSGFPKSHNLDADHAGWGTALKPAHEPIVLARKPLVGSVAATVAVHGTGAINIDACRIASSDNTTKAWRDAGDRERIQYRTGTSGPPIPTTLGRWPANVIHDGSDEVVAAFPAAPGQQGYVGPEHGDRPSRGVFGDYGARAPTPPRSDTGSAARFFMRCPFEDQEAEEEWLALNLPNAFASIADNRLHLPSLLGAFARSAAAISALPAEMSFVVVAAPSTAATVSECALACAMLIRAIRIFENALWRGQPLGELTLSASHVQLVARQMPTGITMTMTSQSASSGFAEPATFSIMPQKEEVGGPGCVKRLLYCAKASKADRDEGLDALPKRPAGTVSETSGQHITRRDEGHEAAPRANNHPTVKPEALMRWLVRLVTPVGGLVLDPFTGSGSTGKAAMLEGMAFVGCELTVEYLPIARGRIAAAEERAAREADEAARIAAEASRQRDLFAA
jgi:DNA modification methylase